MPIFNSNISFKGINNFKMPTKSACVCCPFRDDKGWLEMKKNSPIEFADAVEFDKNIRTINKDSDMKNYTHRSCKPLDEVDFDKKDNQLDMFNNECEGLCSV